MIFQIWNALQHLVRGLQQSHRNGGAIQCREEESWKLLFNSNLAIPNEMSSMWQLFWNPNRSTGRGFYCPLVNLLTVSYLNKGCLVYKLFNHYQKCKYHAMICITTVLHVKNYMEKNSRLRPWLIVLPLNTKYEWWNYSDRCQYCVKPIPFWKKNPKTNLECLDPDPRLKSHWYSTWHSSIEEPHFWYWSF